VTDLRLCQALGLSYADVRALPQVVYEIALEDLLAAARAREEAVA
jgi:hypothetical protein